MNKNAGVFIGENGVAAAIAAVDTFADNNGTGFEVTDGTLFLARSTAIRNGIGVDLSPVGGVATSFGDNHINGNGTDVKGGALTKVGMQ